MTLLHRLQLRRAEEDCLRDVIAKNQGDLVVVADFLGLTAAELDQKIDIHQLQLCVEMAQNAARYRAVPNEPPGVVDPAAGTADFGGVFKADI